MDPLDDRTIDALNISEMRYQRNLSQKEIARQLACSPAAVSRLLQFARDSGLVRTLVCPPSNLEQSRVLSSLLKPFGIRRVIVTPNGRRYVGEAASRFFEQAAKTNCTVVLDGGLTTSDFVDALRPKTVSSVNIVPIASDPPSYDVSAYELMARMSTKYESAKCWKLPYTKRPLLDKIHRRVCRVASKADFIFLGIGPWKRGFTALELIFHLGFAPSIVLRRHPNVVAVCGYIGLSREGKHLPIPEMDRQIRRALDLPDLQQLTKSEKSHTVLLAATREKISAVFAGIAARLCNTLIVDGELATALEEHYS